MFVILLGSVLWNQAVRFGLSAEEVGLFINQLPQYPIELSRTPGKFGHQDMEASGDHAGGGSGESIDKVLKIEPGESGTVKFTMDFIKDGVGGQEHEGLVRTSLYDVVVVVTLSYSYCLLYELRCFYREDRLLSRKLRWIYCCQPCLHDLNNRCASFCNL